MFETVRNHKKLFNPFNHGKQFKTNMMTNCHAVCDRHAKKLYNETGRKWMFEMFLICSFADNCTEIFRVPSLDPFPF